MVVFFYSLVQKENSLFEEKKVVIVRRNLQGNQSSNILIVNKGTNFKNLKCNDLYIHYLQKRFFKVLVYEQNLVSYPGFDDPVTHR